MKEINKNLKKQDGFSLLLVILILSAMLVTTLLISSMVLEIGRSLTKVAHSEVALYSAEAGIEDVLYSINKEYLNIDSVDIDKTLVNLEGKYFIKGETMTVSPETDNNDIELIREALVISLEYGDSFELNYDLNTSHYEDLEFNFTGSGEGDHLIMTITSFKYNEGTLVDFEEEIRTDLSITENIVIDGDRFYKIRIYNSNTSGSVAFNVTQGSSDDDPIIGVKIKSHGQYKSTERIIEVENIRFHEF